MISESLLKRYYGDPKYDLTTSFFNWIKENAGPQSIVLNLGAGPGNGDDRCSLKGHAGEVVGTDIDPEILTNPQIDRGVVTDGVTLPFPDNFFDAAFSDYVIEHVEKPVPFLAEVHRVLKPGGSYFFRTPNLYHYFTIASRLTPHSMHTRFANAMRGLPRETHEPWPTYYRLNSRASIQAAAKASGFSGIDLRMTEGHPAYLAFHKVPFLLGVGYERLVNSSPLFSAVRCNILGRLTK